MKKKSPAWKTNAPPGSSPISPSVFLKAKTASSLQLRKPSKRQGKIRVVEITGLDRSACGGTHLRTSAEIGLLKIVKTDRVRANVRLYYLSGFRALGDYRLKHDVAQRLQRTVTQPLAEIPHQVETLLKEKDELRRALKKALHRELEREIAADVAAGEDLVVREFSGIDAAELRFFAAALIKQGRQVLAYSTTPTRAYRHRPRPRNFRFAADQRRHFRPAGRKRRRRGEPDRRPRPGFLENPPSDRLAADQPRAVKSVRRSCKIC